MKHASRVQKVRFIESILILAGMVLKENKEWDEQDGWDE